MKLTVMSPAEYKKLLEAAKAKNKFEAFLKWQRGKFIVLKGGEKGEPTT